MLYLIFFKFDIKWWGFYPEGNHLPNNVAVWTKILKMSTFHTSLILNVSEVVFQCPVATGKKKKSYPFRSTFQHLNISWFRASNIGLFLFVVLFCFKVHSTAVRLCHLWFDKLNILYKIYSALDLPELKVKLFYQTINIKRLAKGCSLLYCVF